MKPDWKDAPECAKFLAKDASGEWYWFEERPIIEGQMWISRTIDTEAYLAGFDDSWKDSLEARPDDAPNPPA